MSQTNCAVCNVELPASATGPYCDDHEDGKPTARPEREPDRPVRVIHNGLISKRNGGLEEMIHA